MIRIIGGKYKGKRLKKVQGTVVRPMPDKLKESLFSILQDEVRGSVFLDGFAGTGSVGIEALSRGAERIVFVDKYYPAVKVIKINVAKCGVEERVRMIHKEFNRAVIQLSKEKAKFDLIFLDPPYKLVEERNPLKVIYKREILGEGGRIILRHFYKTDFEAKFFELQRRVTIGDDTLAFYSEEIATLRSR
jgi:16S rRNA (guanine966-N2)-methyltransferase